MNVGCIPKKLLHFVSQLGEHRTDMNESGWTVDNNVTHKWETAMEKINDYIRGLNFGYKKALNAEDVKYYNKLAKLISKHEIELTDKTGAK